MFNFIKSLIKTEVETKVVPKPEAPKETEKEEIGVPADGDQVVRGE